MSNPDSFAGSNFAAFIANSPFSMEEQATLNLIAGGSITGFNQSMTTGVPEPKTWAMLVIGFGPDGGGRLSAQIATEPLRYLNNSISLR